MKQFEHCIRAARQRLCVGRILHSSSRTIGAAAVVFALTVLVQRLYDLEFPLVWIGTGLAAVALAAATTWALYTLETPALAAARLDAAAGLAERLSTGQYCLDSQDRFSQAVVSDAERISISLQVRRHMPIAVPRALPFSVASIAVASLMFLIEPGLLKEPDDQPPPELLEHAKTIVDEKMKPVRKLAETIPVLQEITGDFGDLNEDTGGMLKRPADVRHEAVKRIDKMQDLLAQKRDTGDHQAVNEARKMMRRLQFPKDKGAVTGKLAKALRQGDFKAAQREVESLQEKLATLKAEVDKQAVAKLSKQLEELGKQLQQTAGDQDVKKKLADLDMSPEEIDRLLQNLRKKDLDQLQERLADKGWTPDKIDKLLNQIKKSGKAGALARELGKGLQKGGRAAGIGDMDEASAGLASASGQLGELEQLEQEMNELDSAMAALQQAREDVDTKCSACRGTGMANGRPCAGCQGSGAGKPGSGMGKLGAGRGGLAPEEKTQVGFKIERAKVHTGKGAIIGQFLVDGEQIKGDVATAFTEVISAAERDAADRISRDRVPRQYQRAVREYFSNVQRTTRGAEPITPAPARDQADDDAARADHESGGD